MSHLIIAILFALLAYFVVQAFWATRAVVYAIIAVLVFLIVYYGTSVLL